MPNVNYELTPEELKFFESGELPPEIAPEATVTLTTVTADPVATPATPETVVPKVDAPDPNGYLEQLLGHERQRAEQMEKALKDMEKQLESLKAPKVPDAMENPFGHLMHKIGDLTKQVQDMKDNLTQSGAKSEQMSAEQRFQHAIQSSIADFQKGMPDYSDAYAHL